MRLLIVAYWFPPAGGIAVQRALNLAKYLPSYGIEVHVLAPLNPPAPQLDLELIRQIPPEVTVHRAFTPMPPASWRKRLWSLVSPGANREAAPARASEPAGASRPARPAPSGIASWLKNRLRDCVRRVLSPDPEVVWAPFAKRKAARIVRQYGIDAVLVTAPPFSMFLVGNALKRRFPALKLISDFRDDWLRFFLTAFDFHSSDAIRRRAAAIERATVELSDAVVVVTGSLLRETRQRYPDLPAQKFVYIPNGYDPGAFSSFRARQHETGKVVVTYVGTVYGTTSPRQYLDAADSLPDDVKAQWETRFVGRITPDEAPVLENRGTSVRPLGFIPQAEAVRSMEETDYLLVVMADPTATTGKIYEYLATGKPILAISPAGGELDLLLRETGAGECADPADPDAIRSMLLRAYWAVRSGNVENTRNHDAIRRYERPRLAGEFARLVQDR